MSHRLTRGCVTYTATVIYFAFVLSTYDYFFMGAQRLSNMLTWAIAHTESLHCLDRNSWSIWALKATVPPNSVNWHQLWCHWDMHLSIQCIVVLRSHEIRALGATHFQGLRSQPTETLLLFVENIPVLTSSDVLRSLVLDLHLWEIFYHAAMNRNPWPENGTICSWNSCLSKMLRLNLFSVALPEQTLADSSSHVS